MVGLIFLDSLDFTNYRNYLPSSKPTTPIIMSVEKEPLRVIVTDINVPFWSVFSLILKVAIAAIPAGIVFFLLLSFLTAIFIAGI